MVDKQEIIQKLKDLTNYGWEFSYPSEIIRDTFIAFKDSPDKIIQYFLKISEELEFFINKIYEILIDFRKEKIIKVFGKIFNYINKNTFQMKIPISEIKLISHIIENIWHRSTDRPKIKKALIKTLGLKTTISYSTNVDSKEFEVIRKELNKEENFIKLLKFLNEKNRLFFYDFSSALWEESLKWDKDQYLLCILDKVGIFVGKPIKVNPKSVRVDPIDFQQSHKEYYTVPRQSFPPHSDWGKSIILPMTDEEIEDFKNKKRTPHQIYKDNINKNLNYMGLWKAYGLQNREKAWDLIWKYKGKKAIDFEESDEFELWLKEKK